MLLLIMDLLFAIFLSLNHYPMYMYKVHFLSKLKDIDLIKAVRKQNNKTYIDAQDKTGDELVELTKKNILDKNKKALSDYNKKLKKD